MTERNPLPPCLSHLAQLAPPDAAIEAENAALRAALAGLVHLTEAWAYGPIMQAGIDWPGGTCRAPALLAAKAALAPDARP